jgi:hypothetical protein
MRTCELIRKCYYYCSEAKGYPLWGVRLDYKTFWGCNIRVCWACSRKEVQRVQRRTSGLPLVGCTTQHQPSRNKSHTNNAGDSRVLTMVRNTQNYWRFGHCPSSGILKTLKNTTFRKLDLLPFSGEGGRHLTLSSGVSGRHKTVSHDILQLII